MGPPGLGTGACAAAVAAAVGGRRAAVGRGRRAGGEQRVEWTDDGVLLTGWARRAVPRDVDRLMRTLHEAVDVVETYSPAEQRVQSST